MGVHVVLPMGFTLGLFLLGQGCDQWRHHASLQQRVDYLEKIMGDSADKHAAHMKKLEAGHFAEKKTPMKSWSPVMG